jgi:hypothetical protein
VDVTNVIAIQDDGEFPSPATTSWPSLDLNDPIISSASTPAEPTHSHPTPPTASEPLTSTAGNTNVKAEVTSKMPFGTQKSRAATKRTFQDVFTDGSAKDNQVLERLGTQKHERVLGEQELKRQKLEQKAMDKQHQREREREQGVREREREQGERERERERNQHEREREREQHEFRMLKMRMMISQNSHGASVVTQSQNQPSFEGFGLMAELNDVSLPPDSPYST